MANWLSSRGVLWMAAGVGALAYSHAATIWRINFGWRKRQPGDDGVWINTETGEWAKSPDEDEDDSDIAPGATRVRHMIPFVEDSRNCLSSNRATRSICRRWPR